MPEPITFKFVQTARKPLTPKEIRKRLEYASQLEIPHLFEVQPHEGRCLVVGGAPSVVDFIMDIRRQKRNLIISLNGAYQYLVENGVVPRIHIFHEDDITDVRQSLGGEPKPGTYFYISSQCSKHIFEQLEGCHRVLWHSWNELPGYPGALKKLFPGEFAVGFTGLTFFRSLAVARVLGYRNFELYGCDGSVRDGERYLPGYQTENTEDLVSIWGTDPRTGESREFKTYGLLAFQADQFIKLCQDFPDTKFRVHGDGLMKYVHEARYPHQYSEERSL